MIINSYSACYPNPAAEKKTISNEKDFFKASHPTVNTSKQ